MTQVATLFPVLVIFLIRPSSTYFSFSIDTTYLGLAYKAFLLVIDFVFRKYMTCSIETTFGLCGAFSQLYLSTSPFDGG